MTRVIPILLLQGAGLVKTVRFKDPKYVGDPRNAVKIFNEKEVDELVVLDIKATAEGGRPRFELIREIVGLGAAWTKFSEQQDQTIKAMNSLMEHEALRKAVSRRAAALERVIAAGAPLTVIAEQARSLTDR